MSDHPTHRGPHEAPAVESDACIAFRGRLSAYLDGLLADGVAGERYGPGMLKLIDR